VYVPFLTSSGAVAALIRPDHYVFGFANTPASLAELVDSLHSQLSGAGPLE
jgi:flavoprotein hydroxylase